MDHSNPILVLLILVYHYFISDSFCCLHSTMVYMDGQCGISIRNEIVTTIKPIWVVL